MKKNSIYNIEFAHDELMYGYGSDTGVQSES